MKIWNMNMIKNGTKNMKNKNQRWSTGVITIYGTQKLVDVFDVKQWSNNGLLL